METKKLGRTEIEVPVIGMGTWNVAPPDTYAPAEIDEEKIIEALRFGIEKGLVHIDAAEMYGDGRAEELIGRAIKGIERSKLFIASKVSPHHFAYDGVLKATEKSLDRLGTDYIDLHQLHWPSYSVPIGETMRAMERLAEEGSIRFIGVSNFSVAEFKEAQSTMSRYKIVSNQVRYHVLDRKIEGDLLPFAEEEGITVTAYSPFAIGRLFTHSGKGADTVNRLADKYNRTPAQIYLNWLIVKKPVITIPKAVQLKHLEENAAASDWRMEPQDYEAIDSAF